VPLKTGTAALLEGRAASWNDVFRTPWTLSQVIYPREL
jgi:hypothetical protein